MTDKLSDLVRLRQRFLDLQKLGSLTPETFGLFQQSFLEVYHEAERRKQSCQGRANDLRRQAAAADAEANAFSVMSSILYNIVDGHIGMEKRRLAEEQYRQAQEDGTAPTTSASGATYGNGDEEPSAEPEPPPPAEPEVEDPPKNPAKKKPGRPKGSKNKK